MAEFNPELDPMGDGRAQYYDEDHGGSENETERLFSALAVIAACCMIGRFPGFTQEAAAAGTATETSVTVNGNIYWALTVEEATTIEAGFVALETNGTALSAEVALLINKSMFAEPATQFTQLGMYGLYNLNVQPTLAVHFGNFGSYMGSFLGSRFTGAGGFSTPPGFPDFPGGGQPMNDHPGGNSAGAGICYEWIDGTVECFEYR